MKTLKNGDRVYIEGAGCIETCPHSWELDEARWKFRDAVLENWRAFAELPASSCERYFTLVEVEGEVRWRAAIMVKDLPIPYPEGVWWSIFTGRSEPLSQQDIEHHAFEIPQPEHTPYRVDLAPDALRAGISNSFGKRESPERKSPRYRSDVVGRKRLGSC
jgi:hypothetical protein